MPLSISNEERIKLHKELHGSLDQLVSIWIGQRTGRFPSKMNLLQFMQWSHEQMTKPEETSQ
jgi:hypothetical protein